MKVCGFTPICYMDYFIFTSGVVLILLGSVSPGVWSQSVEGVVATPPQ